MKKLEIIQAQKATNGVRRGRIDAWIEALSKSEAAARRKAAADLKQTARYFLINYRVAIDNSVAKGTEAERRSALVEIIESLKPVDKHLSTSTWLVRLHIQEATDIVNLLIGPLDAELDGLHVTRVSNTNRAAFGVTDLQS